MSTVFIRVVKISTLSTFIICLILLLRFFIKDKPKKYSYYLWSVLYFRLVNPFFIDSKISVIPGKIIGINETARHSIIAPTSFAVSTVQKILPMDTEPIRITAKAVEIKDILMIIWLIGILIFLGYALYSKIKLDRMVRSAVRLKNQTFQGECIQTPFVRGIFDPRIYVPVNLSEQELDHILNHENFHIRRKDQLVCVLVYTVTVIYWFNPLVWLAYYLFLYDMETSCDEGVLVEKNLMYKQNYARTLMYTAVRLSNLTGALGFMSGHTKKRIKNLLRVKDRRKYDVLVFTLLLSVMFIVLNTTPILANTVKIQESSFVFPLPEGWQQRLKVSEVETQILISRINGKQGRTHFDKTRFLTFQELGKEFIDEESGMYINDSLNYDIGDTIFVEDIIGSLYYSQSSDTTTFSFKSSPHETIYFRGDLRPYYFEGDWIQLRFRVIPFHADSEEFETLDYNYSLQVLEIVPDISDYLN